MHWHTENELSTSRLSKVRARTGQTDTDRQTDKWAERITAAAFADGNNYSGSN